MKSREEAFAEKSFRYWKPQGDAEIDSRFLDLFRSGLFKHFQRFSEQVFVILDHRDMSYAHISDNVTAVLGYPAEELYSRGSNFLVDKYHPDDLEKLPVLFPMLATRLKDLSEPEIMDCCVSYDFRMLLGDGRYHWIQQQTIPLTMDHLKNIVHALVIVTDVTAYKNQQCCCYRIVMHGRDSAQGLVLLEGSMGDARARGITPREAEIIQLIATGKPEKDIAEALGISVQTVKVHRRNLLRKTGVSSSAELIHFAMANMII